MLDGIDLRARHDRIDLGEYLLFLMKGALLNALGTLMLSVMKIKKKCPWDTYAAASMKLTHIIQLMMLKLDT